MVEAIAAYQKAIEISAGNPNAAAALATGVCASRQEGSCGKDSWRTWKNRRASTCRLIRLPQSMQALARRTKRLNSWKKPAKNGPLDITYHIKADPRIDNLRSDARFHEPDASDWPPRITTRFATPSGVKTGWFMELVPHFWKKKGYLVGGGPRGWAPALGAENGYTAGIY